MKKQGKKQCYFCGYEWEYKGKSDYWITCPKCMKKLSLKKMERLKKGE